MSHSDLIHITADDSTQTISFSSDHLNHFETARQLGSHLSEWISGQPWSHASENRLHLDFQQIDRIGSAALNELIGINAQARNFGVRLVLINVQEPVRDVFAVTRLERMFEFASTAGAS